jgi:hypothetical protein
LRLLAYFSQLIETRRALSEVSEHGNKLVVLGFGGKPRQNLASRTIDALGIRKVLVHDSVERVDQFLFKIHSPHRVAVVVASSIAVLTPAESHDPAFVSMKICFLLMSDPLSACGQKNAAKRDTFRVRRQV